MNILLNHVLWGLLIIALAWACFMMFDSLVRYFYSKHICCYEDKFSIFNYGYDDDYNKRIGIGWNHVSIWFYCHGYYIGLDR